MSGDLGVPTKRMSEIYDDINRLLNRIGVVEFVGDMEYNENELCATYIVNDTGSVTLQHCDSVYNLTVIQDGKLDHYERIDAGFSGDTQALEAVTTRIIVTYLQLAAKHGKPMGPVLISRERADILMEVLIADLYKALMGFGLDDH